MIKIGNNIITYDAQFRQYFEWEAVRKTAGKVARDETLFVDGHDIDVQQMLARVLDRGLGGLVAGADNGRPTLTDGEDGGMTLTLVHQTAVGEERARTFSAPEWIALMLHELARRAAPEALLDGQSSASAAVSPLADEIRLHADQQLELVLFTPASRLEGRLRTVRIVNGSSLPGYATVVVKTPGGRMVDMVRVRHRECLFANFVGDCVVELLPRFVAACGHCNYLTGEGDRLTLGRRLFATGQTRVYSPDRCAGITQFCPDSEGGFVGVVDGRLLPFSTLIRPDDDCDFPLADDERFVKVVIGGRMLLALTDRGRTCSNYPSSPLAGLENVVSVGIGRDNGFYALTSDARLVHGQPSWRVPVEDVYAVCASDAHSFAVRTRDGITHFPSGRTFTGMGRQAVSASGVEVMMNPDGTLACKGGSVALEHEADDFALVDDALSCDKELVVVYHCRDVECFKLNRHDGRE